MIPRNDRMNSHVLAFELFSSETKVSELPKYDKACPMQYFLAKYTGGPFSNTKNRKPVTSADIMKAAIRI